MGFPSTGFIEWRIAALVISITMAIAGRTVYLLGVEGGWLRLAGLAMGAASIAALILAIRGPRGD